MIDNQISEIKVIRLDDLPMLFAVLDELHIAEIIDRMIVQHPNWVGELSCGQVVVGWLVYILSTSDHRLNHVEDWVAQRLDVYSACFNKPVRALDFSDDRLAYILDKLSEIEIWIKIETKLNKTIIRVYDLQTDLVRLDPTTISTYAAISPDGLLQLGHSKDRRPEDAQLKLQLATLDPLSLPLVTQVVAGNSADDPLYVPAVRQVQASIGTGGKTYIGDVKMAAWETRATIVAGDDFYLCPLGQKQLSAKEREVLIAPALHGEVSLTPINRERLDPLGIKPPVVEEIAVGYEVSVPLEAVVDDRAVQWEERRLIVRSHAYADAEVAQLDKQLDRATQELENLVMRKQGKRRLDEEQTREAAEQIIARHHVENLLSARVETTKTRRKVRSYKGRPAQTRTQTQIAIKVEPDQEAIKAAKERMGWRVYASNQKDLSFSALVLAYRGQYLIEHGISRLKGRPLGLSPIFLQTESRMVGLINLLTIALRFLTLFEFRVRRELKAEGKPLKNIYAGQPGRQTMRPSTELLLEAFAGVDAVAGAVNGQFVSYLRPLTATQQRILRLLGLDDQLYEKLLCYFQKSPL